MPKKFRYELGEEFYITRGVGCLCVFTADWKQKLEAELNSLGNPLDLLLNPDIARLHRHFFWEMSSTGADSQFRVVLSAEHRRYAGIGTEVVICGCGNFIELWSPERLESYKQDNDKDEDLIASGAAVSAARASGDRNPGVSQTGPG